jgi:hypothetical protein
MNKNNFKKKINTEKAEVKLWVLMKEGARWNSNTPLHKRSIIIYGYRTKSRNESIESLKRQFYIRQHDIIHAKIFDNQTKQLIEILK